MYLSGQKFLAFVSAINLPCAIRMNFEGCISKCFIALIYIIEWHIPWWTWCIKWMGYSRQQMNKKRFDESKISQPHKFLLEESSFGHGNFTVIISKNYFDKNPWKCWRKKAPRKTKIKKGIHSLAETLSVRQGQVNHIKNDSLQANGNEQISVTAGY